MFIPLSLSRFHRSRGFGLLEVILVFALVIGASALVFGVFDSASTKASANREADLLTLVKSNIASLMAGKHDYTGLTTAQAIQGKAIPVAYVNADGVTAHNTYGNSLTVSAYGGVYWPAECGVAWSCYTIKTSVAKKDCVDTIVALQFPFSMIIVNGHQMTRPTGIIKPDKVAGFCQDTDPAVIQLWSK